MSVNRDLREYELWKKENVRSPSGAPKEIWKQVGVITAALYKMNDRIQYGSERYNQVSHMAQTYEKNLKSGLYQIRRDGRTYDITDTNPDGRMAVLLLKEVDTNV